MCQFCRKMCTNQDIYNIPFIMRGNHFLVHGHKKDLPHITCILSSFKICSKMSLVSPILHHFSLLRLLPKSYLKISTFQPNVLCSSFFKWRLMQISITATQKCVRRIQDQLTKRHCQCCVYLDTLLNKLQKQPKLRTRPVYLKLTEKLLLPSITLGTPSEHFMT